MSNDNEIHVRHSDGLWRVERPASARASARRTRQDEAVQVAENLIKRQGGGTVYIHQTDGKARKRNVRG